MAERISSEIFEKTITDNYPTEPTSIEWCGLEVEVKRLLSLEEMIAFVEYVVSGHFAGTDNGFTPELGVLAHQCAVIEYYTNIALPDSTTLRYELLTKVKEDLIYKVINAVDHKQYWDMVQAIRDRVGIINEANISEFNKTAQKLFDGLNEIEQNFADLFGGLTGDDMNKIIGAISNGVFDEEKLMNAYFERKDTTPALSES